MDEPVPDWLADRLVYTAGMDRARIEEMTPEVAMEAWEAFITRPG